MARTEAIQAYFDAVKKQGVYSRIKNDSDYARAHEHVMEVWVWTHGALHVSAISLTWKKGPEMAHSGTRLALIIRTEQYNELYRAEKRWTEDQVADWFEFWDPISVAKEKGYLEGLEL